MTPTTEADLAEIIRMANTPLAIQGGGTRPIGRPVAGDALSTSGMTGINLYEPGALTVVAKAGTPVAEIETLLASENQRLAFEPMDHRALTGTDGTPTIGGMVATNTSGPRRIQAGACRDSLLGVKFVDGQGQHISNGGRVMKNVTGYDLVKLMAGSYGTLGVMTEVALKVLPQPETEATLVLQGLSVSDAVSALSQALGSPFEVTGAAHLPGNGTDPARTMVRIEGLEASVNYRLVALKTRLSTFGEISDIQGDSARAAWSDLRDVTLFAKMAGNVWRLSVKPSDAPHIAARLGADVPLQLDWGGGLIWVLAMPGSDITGTFLRRLIAETGGHATLIRGEDPAPFQPQPAPLATLEEGLRHKFDPKGILNPGRLG